MTKSILIVGAERGLGLGLAEQFLNRAWHVVATARPQQDVTALESLSSQSNGRLAIRYVDVLSMQSIREFVATIENEKFDVVFMNAGVWGPLHQSVLQATDQELQLLFNTNSIGPIRVARTLLDNGCLKPRGTLAFMTSHRGSTGLNVEGGIELYRASKAALNMMVRGLYAEVKNNGLTILLIHPGWAATAMGTLDGTVQSEISVEESVAGVVTVVEQKMGSGANLYLDYTGATLPW